MNRPRFYLPVSARVTDKAEMCGTLHSMLPHAPAQRKLAGLAGSMKAYTVQADIS